MRRQRAFTMAELLVVIAIIVVLLGLLAPMVAKAWKTGLRTRTAADLQAVATALEAYRQDHGDYPEVHSKGPGNAASGPNNWNGAKWLCQTMVGPGPASLDGADGPGFRTRKDPGPDGRPNTADDVGRGRVYGPYLRPELFKLGNPSTRTTGRIPNDPAFMTFYDRHNKPVLYYRAVGKVNVRVAKGYVGERTGSDKPLYNSLDNWDQRGRGAAEPNAPSTQTMRRMLGDINANGMIDPGETPAYEGPYLLWSAGPDEIYGPESFLTTPSITDQAKLRKAVELCDDVTNFRG